MENRITQSIDSPLYHKRTDLIRPILSNAAIYVTFSFSINHMVSIMDFVGGYIPFSTITSQIHGCATH